MITCITISERPWATQKMPRRIRHTNLVAGELTRPELHQIKLESIAAVETQDFFFQDAEDPLPSFFLSVPPGKGLLVGPIKIIEQKSGITTHRHYTQDFHHVIRAVMNTKKAQRVATLLPRGHYDTEVLLHHFLTAAYGSAYNSSLIMTHRATELRANGLDDLAIRNSKKWIQANEQRVLWALDGDPQDVVLEEGTGY